MRKTFLLLTLAYSITAGGYAQQSTDSLRSRERKSGQVYLIKPAIDIPLLAGGAAWDLYGFSQISKKSNSSVAEVNSLKTANVDWLDRWAIHPYSHHIDKLSYIPFYVAMPLPLIAFGIDSRMRPDFWKLTYLYGEAMTLTGVLYTSAVHYVNRHRPLVYESASPIEERTASNSRNSFFAGHVALVGTSVFFIAQAYADYHPDSHIKWVFYGGAEAITALTAYLRNRAGEHFFTDITLGNIVENGIGHPHTLLHRQMKVRHNPLSILPFSGHGQGLTMLYSIP